MTTQKTRKLRKATTQADFDRVHQLKQRHPKLSTQVLADLTDFSTFTVRRILDVETWEQFKAPKKKAVQTHRSVMEPAQDDIKAVANDILGSIDNKELQAMLHSLESGLKTRVDVVAAMVHNLHTSVKLLTDKVEALPGATRGTSKGLFSRGRA